MSWSTSRTGPVLRELREGAGLSPDQLADRMLHEGFSSSRVRTTQDLAEHLRAIEAGEPWPFEHGTDALPFRRACIKAVARHHDDNARLCDAMAADVLAHQGLPPGG